MKKTPFFIKALFFSLLLLFFTSSKIISQITNNGTFILIPSGNFVHSTLDIINNDVNANIINDGTIISTAHISNNGSFTTTNPQSYLFLEGGNQNISGNQSYTLGRLVVSGSADKTVNSNLNILDSLIFVSNKILINNNDIRLFPNAQIKNPDNSKFVVTNGLGSLVKKSLPLSTDFLFPVGDNISSYKPVVINYTGSIDTFAVRVINGLTPPDQTCVQKTYIVKASNPLTSSVNLNLGWNTVDQGTMFTPSQSIIWQNQSGTWTMLPGSFGALSNTPATDWIYGTTNIQLMSVFADSFIVKSAAPPTVVTQPLNDTVCEKGISSFSVSATGLGTLSFQWQINCSNTWTDVLNGGTLPTFTGANDSILNLIDIPLNMNGCKFRCIVNAAGGNTISDTATLTVNPLPIVTIIGDTAICEGDFADLTAYQGISYLWSTGDITQTISVNPITTTLYSVTVTNNFLCSASASEEVFVTPSFSVVLTSNFDTLNEILSGQLVTFTAHPENYDNYDFYLNNTLVQTGTSNIYSNSGLLNGQIVSVIAMVNNCTALSDSIKIKVKPIGNAFTPFDMDGKNDLFAKGVDLIVFNRWAQVLFEGTEGWDGTYNSTRVSPGTYYYIMTINKGLAAEMKLTGIVTVIHNE
ncbi:MAG: gliding motility-associated C-terminal domain-containing protein [Bacteroidales bacterium]|nr:gliding motility-associated C-terminal domain-containing protein [Bacteroidales bacterium]